MKPFLLLSILFLTMNCVGQSSKDTICLPNNIARALLIDAQRHDILKSEVANLNERIKEKQTQLSLTNERDSLLIQSLKKEIILLEDQKNLLVTDNDNKEKIIKKLRRKNRWTAFAGIATTVGAIFLFK